MTTRILCIRFDRLLDCLLPLGSCDPLIERDPTTDSILAVLAFLDFKTHSRVCPCPFVVIAIVPSGTLQGHVTKISDRTHSREGLEEIAKRIREFGKALVTLCDWCTGAKVFGI